MARQVSGGIPVFIVDENGNTAGATPGSAGTSASPTVTNEKSATQMATGQVALATTSTLIANSRAGRKSIVITPTSATVFYVGNTGVTSANGLYVAAGASVTLSTEAAIYGVAPSAVTVSFLETF